jgi:hypothetical protein
MFGASRFNGAHMAAIAAQATERGTVLLSVTSDPGQQGKAELPIEMAEDLKAQLERALLAARVHHIKTTLAKATTAGTFVPQKCFSDRRQTKADPTRQRRLRFPKMFRHSD